MAFYNANSQMGSTRFLRTLSIANKTRLSFKILNNSSWKSARIHENNRKSFFCTSGTGDEDEGNNSKDKNTSCKKDIEEKQKPENVNKTDDGISKIPAHKSPSGSAGGGSNDGDGKQPKSSGFPPGGAPGGFGDDTKSKKRVLGKLSNLLAAPQSVTGLHGGYAMALYSVAKRQHKLDKAETDLIKLKEMYAKDTSFRDFIDHPESSTKVKLEVLGSLSSLDLDVITMNMLRTLIENYRLNKLMKVIEGFLDICATHKGQVMMELVTARQLKPEQRDQLFGVLLKMFPGKTFHASERVDPELLAGFTVTIGEIHIDMSAKKVVQNFEKVIRVKV